MSYTHLTEKERYVISHMHMAHFSFREIGRRLGRYHTSIRREIGRLRGGHDFEGVRHRLM